MPRSERSRLHLPTAAGGLARLAAQEVRRAGVDLAPLIRASGLTPDLIDSGERLASEEQITFVELSARALERDQLGFELGKAFDLRSIGPLYYVAASSETLGMALLRVARFSAVGNEAVVIGNDEQDNAFRIRLAYSGVACHSDRHQIEFFVATLVRLCRALSGLLLMPVHASFCHARSRGTKSYDECPGAKTLPNSGERCCGAERNPFASRRSDSRAAAVA